MAERMWNAAELPSHASGTFVLQRLKQPLRVQPRHDLFHKAPCLRAR